MILVSIDTLRADAIGAYGGAVATPTLDRLAAEGVLLERAFAPTPTTAPTHATIFSGLHVQNHGTLGNGHLSLSELPLVEAFRAEGYATAGFVSSYVLSPRLGWGVGFDTYDADFGSESGLREMEVDLGPLQDSFEGEALDRSAIATTALARDWVAAASEPFFLFVHYFDPHAPYRMRGPYVQKLREAGFDPPARAVPGHSEQEVRRARIAYQSEVLYVDEALAGLLRAFRNRGILDRTLVVVTSDHGEGLGQHGWMAHTRYLYDEQVHVPWILRWPGRLPAGARIRTPVGLEDLAPTIAELAGVTLPGDADGRSLAADLARGADPAPGPVFGFRPPLGDGAGGQLGELRSVRAEDWKYIRSEDGPDELYDLGADPGELHSLHPQRPDEGSRLGALLDAHVEARRRHAEQTEMDDAQRERLRALGYVE